MRRVAKGPLTSDERKYRYELAIGGALIALIVALVLFAAYLA